jgi:hypothetical protein
MGKNHTTKLTADRRRHIKARLDEGYEVTQIMKAIVGCSKSPFHMGDNDRHTPYNDIVHICRNATKLDAHLHVEEKKQDAVKRDEDGKGYWDE